MKTFENKFYRNIVIVLVSLLLTTIRGFTQNYALQFDGINNYVEVPDVINNGDFSIEMWFNLSDEKGGYLYSASRSPLYFDLSVSKTQIRWRFESQDDSDGNINISGLDLTMVSQINQYVMTGLNGVSRPAGSGFDLGAYEQ